MTEETTSAVEKKPTPSTSPTGIPSNADGTPRSGNPQGNQGGRSSSPRRGGRRNDRRQKAPKEFEESVIAVDRVTRVTRGGRQLRFRVSVVIGNKKGKVGFGIGKSTEVMLGVQKAVAHAKKNMISVSIFEDSVPHEVIGKFKATKVLLFPAQEGKGVIAGGAVRKIMELAGVKNVLSKMHGSSNAINSAYATIHALEKLQDRTPIKKTKEPEDESAESNDTTKSAISANAASKSEKKGASAKTEKKSSPKASDSKTTQATKKKNEKTNSKKEAIKADDLTKIEGIGPKIAEILIAKKISTFEDLAKTKVENIRIYLDEAGNQFKSHDPETWPKQSEMAAKGDWDGLKEWQDELQGGKSA